MIERTRRRARSSFSRARTDDDDDDEVVAANTRCERTKSSSNEAANLAFSSDATKGEVLLLLEKSVPQFQARASYMYVPGTCNTEQLEGILHPRMTI